MIHTREIEVGIAKCLSSLIDLDITVATLPNKANQTYEKINSKPTINIVIPVVAGERPTSDQMFRYEVLIHILTTDRISTSENIATIDGIKNQIFSLVSNNFSSYVCSKSFWFSNYRLIPAKGGYWSAEINLVVEKYI